MKIVLNFVAAAACGCEGRRATSYPNVLLREGIAVPSHLATRHENVVRVNNCSLAGETLVSAKTLRPGLKRNGDYRGPV
jgi:hypothetical protein